MGKDIVPVDFDYDLVEDDIRGKLIWFEGEIKKITLVHVNSGLALGELLTQAHELLDNKRLFQEWVEGKFGISVRSAYNHMLAHREFSGCATVSQIELGAMYVLAKNERAKKKALKYADRGVVVTQKMAKQLVKEAGGPEEPKEEPAEEPEVDPEQQAKHNAKVAKDLIDRAVRAVDDLHYVKPNRAMRDRIVAALQKCGKAVW